MNRRGFTLVELLASLVILGLLMGVAIPNVVGTIRKQRKNTYVEDAKRLVTRAKTMISANNLDKSVGTCYSLRFLDNGDFSEAPNGGKYLRYYSYVAIANDGSYVVNLVECTSCTTGQEDAGEEGKPALPSGSSFQGISNTKYSELIGDNATSRVQSLASAGSHTYNAKPSGSCYPSGTFSCTGVYYHPDKPKA